MRSVEVNGFPGYRVTDCGKVYSLKRNKLIELKPDITSGGYFRVTLSNAGVTKRYTVHRLVAMHFINNLGDKPFVNHKDGNKKNNHYSNLEWCSCAENTKHAFDSMLRLHGETAPNSQLSDEVVHQVCSLIQQGLRRKQILDLNIHPLLTKSKFDDIRSRSCWRRVSQHYCW